MRTLTKIGETALKVPFNHEKTCFVLCVRALVRIRISPSRIKLAASNFARWFIGVLGREFPILCNFNSASHREVKFAVHIIAHCKRHATDALFVEYRSACGRRIGMCGYTAVPEDGSIGNLLVLIKIVVRYYVSCAI